METINDKLFEYRSCNIKFLAKEGFNTPRFYDFESYDDFIRLLKDKVLLHKDEKLKGLIQSVNIFDEDITSAVYYDFSNIHISILREISWSNNTNGEMVPLAKFDSIKIGGTDYDSCSLKNTMYLEKLIISDKLKIGDKILILLKDDKIPHIFGVAEHTGNDEIAVPSDCPICGENTTIINSNFICENISCPTKLMDGIYSYINLVALDEKNKTIMKNLLKKHTITSIASLHKFYGDSVDKVSVSKGEFLDLVIPKSNGVRVLNHIINSFEFDILLDNKTTGDTILKALSIDGELAENLLETITDQIKSIQNNIKYFDISDFDEAVLKNKIFCFTNTMNKDTMKGYESMVISNGGIIGNVTQKLDYLVTNETDTKTTKYKKVSEINTKLYNTGKTHAINVVSEETFNKMMEK